MDEAERCSKIALINNGEVLKCNTSQNLICEISFQIFEIICSEIRKTFLLLKNFKFIKEVQSFGDRVNIQIEEENKLQFILKYLSENAIEVQSFRKIQPTLENVFISILSKK